MFKCRWLDVFLGIVNHPSAPERMPKNAGDSFVKENPDTPIQNILIWQFDGISRSYYEHDLPKTWAFLESLLEEKSGRGGFLFRGHNTVGWNSLPNMAAFWTGNATINPLSGDIYNATYINKDGFCFSQAIS